MCKEAILACVHTLFSYVPEENHIKTWIRQKCYPSNRTVRSCYCCSDSLFEMVVRMSRIYC